MINRLINSALIVIFGMLLLSGCASQGPILVDFQYQPPQGVSAVAAKATLGVSPFRDDRGKSASVIGTRSFESGDKANGRAVTAARRATRRSGFSYAMAGSSLGREPCSPHPLHYFPPV